MAAITVTDGNLLVIQGTTWVDPGCVPAIAEGGTSISSGEVDTSTIGVYTITYANEDDTATRSVRVIAAIAVPVFVADVGKSVAGTINIACLNFSNLLVETKLASGSAAYEQKVILTTTDINNAEVHYLDGLVEGSLYSVRGRYFAGPSSIDNILYSNTVYSSYSSVTTANASKSLTAPVILSTVMEDTDTSTSAILNVCSRTISMTWNFVDYGDSYTVYRKYGTDTYYQVSTGSGRSYSDSSLTWGSDVTYKVTAKSSSSTSNFILGNKDSNELHFIVNNPPALFTPVVSFVSSTETSVVVSLNSVNNQNLIDVVSSVAKVTFQYSIDSTFTSNVSSFVITHEVLNGVYYTQQFLGALANVTISSLITGTVYYVRAKLEVFSSTCLYKDSAFGISVAVSTQQSLATPQITATGSSLVANTNVITFVNIPSGTASCILQRLISGNNWLDIYNFTDTSILSYSDNNLIAGSSYSYRLLAVPVSNTGYISAYSTTVTAIPRASLPNAVMEYIAVDSNSCQFKVSSLDSKASIVTCTVGSSTYVFTASDAGDGSIVLNPSSGTSNIPYGNYIKLTNLVASPIIYYYSTSIDPSVVQQSSTNSINGTLQTDIYYYIGGANGSMLTTSDWSNSIAGSPVNTIPSIAGSTFYVDCSSNAVRISDFSMSMVNYPRRVECTEGTLTLAVDSNVYIDNFVGDIVFELVGTGNQLVTELGVIFSNVALVGIECYS